MFSFLKKEDVDKSILEFYDELRGTIKIFDQEKIDLQIEKSYLDELKKTIDEYFRLKNKDCAYRLIEKLLSFPLLVNDVGKEQKIQNSPSLISRLLLLLDLVLEYFLELFTNYKIKPDEKIRSAYFSLKLKELELMAKRRALLDYLDIFKTGDDRFDERFDDKQNHSGTSGKKANDQKVDLETAFFNRLVNFKKAFYLDYKFEWEDFLSNVENVIPGLKIVSEMVEKNLFKVKFYYQEKQIEKRIRFNPEDYLGEHLKGFIEIFNKTLKELSIEKKLFEYTRVLGDDYMIYILDNDQFNLCSSLLLP